MPLYDVRGDPDIPFSFYDSLRVVGGRSASPTSCEDRRDELKGTLRCSSWARLRVDLLTPLARPLYRHRPPLRPVVLAPLRLDNLAKHRYVLPHDYWLAFSWHPESGANNGATGAPSKNIGVEAASENGRVDHGWSDGVLGDPLAAAATEDKRSVYERARGYGFCVSCERNGGKVESHEANG